MRMRYFLLLLFTVLSPLHGGETWNRPIIVPKVREPVVIDGFLEELWLDLPAYDLVDFTGKTTSLIVEEYLTLFRTFHDENFWYFSFVCSDDEPLATMTERDSPLYKEDICEIMIKSPADRYYYELSVSPKGIIYDTRLAWNRNNAFDIDIKWDFRDLRTAVQNRRFHDAAGRERTVWTVEIAIPWKSLPGGKPRPGDTLQGNVLRYKRLKNPLFINRNRNLKFLCMNLFATGIMGWPQGPSALGRFLFRE